MDLLKKQESVTQHLDAFFLLINGVKCCWSCHQTILEVPKKKLLVRWSFCLVFILFLVFLFADSFKILNFASRKSAWCWLFITLFWDLFFQLTIYHFIMLVIYHLCFEIFFGISFCRELNFVSSIIFSSLWPIILYITINCIEAMLYILKSFCVV